MHNFAVVFKSSDPEALNKVLDYLSRNVLDARVVFKTGPTSRFLWVLEGKAGGVFDESK